MAAGHEPLRVELDLHAGGPGLACVWLRFARLALEFCLCLPQRGAAPRARPQLLRQLIAARLPIELILAAVRLRRLGEDLASDLLAAAIGLARGVRRGLRAIDRDHPNRHQSRLPAKSQHAREELGKGGLVAHPKLRDRRVIRDEVPRHDSKRDVLDAGALDHTRGAIAARVGVEQQRHHHRRLVGRPAMTVGAIGAIERAQIHLANSIEHRPRQVVVGHPLAQRRRASKTPDHGHSQ
jgi:hypothetical protein